MCKVRELVVALTMVATSMMGSGCVESAIAAAGATAGFGLAQGQAESFIRGELKSARMVCIADARIAVVAALAELQLPVLDQREGDYDGYIRAKAEGGREIKVYLRADSPVMTRFSIRVGFMGDMAVSRLLMTRIDDVLDTPPSTSMPEDHLPIM